MKRIIEKIRFAIANPKERNTELVMQDFLNTANGIEKDMQWLFVTLKSAAEHIRDDAYQTTDEAMAKQILNQLEVMRKYYE